MHQTLDKEKTLQKFKTKVCIFWLQNNCPYGDRCLFAHGKGQLRADQGDSHVPGIDPEINERYKTRLCRFSLANETCVHGVRCTYAHSLEEQAHYLKLAKDRGVQTFTSTSSAPTSPVHDPQQVNRASIPSTVASHSVLPTTMRMPWTLQTGVSPFLTRPTTTTTTTSPSSSSTTASASTTTTSSKVVTGKTTLTTTSFTPVPQNVDDLLSNQQPQVTFASPLESSSPPGNSPSQEILPEIYKTSLFKQPQTLTANASTFVSGAASALIAAEASAIAPAPTLTSTHSVTAFNNSNAHSSSAPMNFEKYRDPLTGKISVTRMSAGTLALYLNSAYVYNKEEDNHGNEESVPVPNPSLSPPGLGIVEESSALALALQAEELAGRRHLADLARKGLSSIHQNLSTLPVSIPLPVTKQPQQRPPESFRPASWTHGQFKQQEIATAQQANDAVSNAIAQLVSALQLSEATRLASAQQRFPQQSAMQYQKPLDLMDFLSRAQSNLRDQVPFAPNSRLEEVAQEWILGQSTNPASSEAPFFNDSGGGNDSERSFLTLATSITASMASTATNRSLHLSSSHLDNSGSSPPSSSRWHPPSTNMSILGETSSASTSKTCESGSIWKPSAQSSESMIVHRTSTEQLPLLDLSRILRPHTVEPEEGEDDDKGILISLGLSKRGGDSQKDDDDDDERNEEK